MLPKLSLLCVASALVLRASTSLACSPPQEGWQAYVPNTHREGIPLAGLLIFDAQFYLQGDTAVPSTAIDFIDVTVRDAEERIVEGAVRWDAQASELLWQSASPFSPNAQYSVDYTFRNQDLLESLGGFRYGDDQSGSYTFRTVSRALDPVSAPTLVGRVLTESQEPGTQACCDLPMNSCFDGCGITQHCEQCWVLRFAYRPFVDFEWNVQAAENTEYLRYLVEQRRANGEVVALTQPSKNGGNDHHFSNKIDLENGEFCARLVRIRTTDNSRAESEWTCVQQSELMPIPRTDPPSPDTSACLEPPKKEELPSSGKLQTTEGTGCECVGAPPAPVGLGLLLGLLALLALRGASSRDLS